MNDFVIDANVWAWVDYDLENLSATEVKCVIACRNWLKAFVENDDDKLVVDLVRQTIIREYRDVIKPNRLAARYLNDLERKPRDKRLIEIEIEYDANGDGVIPFYLDDESDRKFAAVALAHKPTPPIIDASDTDWEKDKAAISAAGLIVIELCPDYIQQKLVEK